MSEMKFWSVLIICKSEYERSPSYGLKIKMVYFLDQLNKSTKYQLCISTKVEKI